MYSKNQFWIFIFMNKILYNLKPKLKKITNKKRIFSDFGMNNNNNNNVTATSDI